MAVTGHFAFLLLVLLFSLALLFLVLFLAYFLAVLLLLFLRNLLLPPFPFLFSTTTMHTQTICIQASL